MFRWPSGMGGKRDAVCLAASMSYQNLVYNINLLSGGWHFKATKKNCLEPSDICRQLSISLLPTNRPKWPSNRPSSHLFRERNGSTLWGFFRNFYRSFCGVSWSAGEVVARSSPSVLFVYRRCNYKLRGVYIYACTTKCLYAVYILYFLVKDKLKLIDTLWGSKEKLVYF